jgi:cold shock CspA family protein
VNTGTVVRFHGPSGYGFITPDDGGDDVFFHASLLTGDYRESVPSGTRVEYESVTGERGAKAVEVTVLGKSQQTRGRRDDQDDQFCDVLPAVVFAQKITNVLIDVAPSATGAQITEVRRQLVAFAQQHGWVED